MLSVFKRFDRRRKALFSSLRLSYSVRCLQWCYIWGILHGGENEFYFWVVKTIFYEGAQRVSKICYYVSTEIYSLKSHVVNFRTEISSGQSETANDIFSLHWIGFPVPLSSSHSSCWDFKLMISRDTVSVRRNLIYQSKSRYNVA